MVSVTTGGVSLLLVLVEAIRQVVWILVAHVRARPVGDAGELFGAAIVLVTEHVERAHLVLGCSEVLQDVVEV